MRILWRDTLSALLAVFGAVVIYAKLQSYSWWLIGSWTGALGVIAIIGLAILLTNIVELAKLADGATILELSAWLLAATVTVASLFSTTTKAEFVWSGAFIGVAWLAQTSRHLWRGTHSHGHHYIPA